MNTEHLIVPYFGSNLSMERDTFNYFRSPLRVQIENAFALYVNRWGIL
jgi:hypothetical protein